MKIVSLELKNFRNYTHALVEFKDGLNVLYGKNASGKTNMLESVYLCSIFHSPRTTKDKEMILMGESKAQVKIVLESKFRRHTINLQKLLSLEGTQCDICVADINRHYHLQYPQSAADTNTAYAHPT